MEFGVFVSLVFLSSHSYLSFLILSCLFVCSVWCDVWCVGCVYVLAQRKTYGSQFSFHVNFKDGVQLISLSTDPTDFDF